MLGAVLATPHNRRAALRFGVLSLLGLGVARSRVVALAVASGGARISPREALERLLEGNRRFAAGEPSLADISEARRVELAAGQEPFAAIVSCADSRVPPEIIFHQGLGDLFICRVAGNIVDDGIAGSIEYGVGVLGVSLVMVLGHEACGAVKETVNAVRSGAMISPNIDALVAAIRPAVERVSGQPGDPLENAIRENVRLGVQRLTLEPDIAPFIARGQIAVVGGEYNLRTGRVELVR